MRSISSRSFERGTRGITLAVRDILDECGLVEGQVGEWLVVEVTLSFKFVEHYVKAGLELS